MTVLSKRKRTSNSQTAKDALTEHLAPPQFIPIPLRSRKIRFSSTSPAPEEQAVVRDDNDTQEPDKSESDSDSDAAPEAIAHSTAHAQSRAIDADVARAAQARSDAAKKRRRERDTRLKEQANRSKRLKVEQQTSDGDGGGDESLPTLLPDSLLDSIPAVRPPTPPPGDAAEGRMDIDGRETRQKNQVYTGVVKRLSEKPAQDLQIGKLSVSVLESRNELLPPKANAKGRGIRQNWLRGRATMVGKKAMRSTQKWERRPFGKAKTTFVYKALQV